MTQTIVSCVRVSLKKKFLTKTTYQEFLIIFVNNFII